METIKTIKFAKTLWSGRDDARVARLTSDIPLEGECPKSRPALENLRKFTNTYYQLYNNGNRYFHRLRGMAKRHGYENELRSEAAIETLGHILIDAAWLELLQIEEKEEA